MTDILKFGDQFWIEKGFNSKDFTSEKKIHLIFSLIIFLGTSLVQLLHFAFSSQIKEVKKQAGMFVGYQSTAQTDLERFPPAEIFWLWHERSPATRNHLHNEIVLRCGPEISVEESRKLVSDEKLKISLALQSLAVQLNG